MAADGRKLAGVLAEADLLATSASSPPPVVVGIGVNVNWPADDEDLPPGLRGSATSLRQLSGREVDREVLLAALLDKLEARVSALATPAGRVRLAGDLRSACSTLGTRVRVEQADGSFSGTAVAVTDAGHLQVEVAGALRTVVAGDVVHIRPGA